MGSLVFLLLLTLLNHLAYTGIRLAVLLYAAHLGASAMVVGVLAALFGLLAALTSVQVGRWIDRAGSRVPLLVAALTMTAGGVIPFFWRDVVALFVVGTLVGTFHNVVHIAQQQLVGKHGRPQDRAKNFSYSALANSAATFAGPITAGLAIDHAGHALSFVLLAAIGFAIFPCVLFGWLRLPGPAPRRARAHGEAAAGSLRDLLRDAALRRIYAASVLTNGTWAVVNFMIPLYGLQIGLDATRIGTLLGCFAAATMLVRVVLPLLLPRLTPWQLMVTALFMAAASFLVMPLTADYTLLLAVCFWLGLGLGVSGPMTNALLYDASPAERTGEVVGLRVLLQNVCHTLVPLLSGAIGAATGVGPVFWVLSAFMFWGCWDNRGQLKAPRSQGRLPP